LRTGIDIGAATGGPPMKWKLAARGIRLVKERVIEGLRKVGTVDAVSEDPPLDAMRDAAMRQDPKATRNLRERGGDNTAPRLVRNGADPESVRGREAPAGDTPSLNMSASAEKVMAENVMPPEKGVAAEKGPSVPMTGFSPEGHRRQEAPDAAGFIDASAESAMRPKLVLMLRSDTIEAECFKLFRSLLSMFASAPSPRSILFAGIAPGQVMMVDCDLRKTGLKNLLGADGLAALWERFPGDAPSAVTSAGTGGGVQPHRAWLSRSLEPGRAMDELVSFYDERTVIFDSPPPESANRTGYGDGALMVLDYGVLSQENVRNILDRIGRDRILGCVRSRAGRKEMYLGNKRASSMMA